MTSTPPLEPLRRAVADLEAALATPVAAPGWRAQVGEQLAHLEVAFAEQTQLSRAPGGWVATVLEGAPRLGVAVRRLTDEQAALGGQLADLRRDAADDAGSPVQLREQVTRFLGRLVRHRHRASDLLYEAMALDLGAGD
jgi:hypothetical protein